MDIQLIQDTIWELEDSDTTFSNVQELAALYIVKDYLCGASKDVVTTEYNDILPRYCEYKQIKRRYQLKEAPKESVLSSIRYVCKEIQEFMAVLYTGTDLEDERQQIKEMISALYKNYVESA